MQSRPTPDKDHKEIAEMTNDSQDRLDDKISVTPQDVAQQKKQLKKPGAAQPMAAPVAAPAPEAPKVAKRGRPKGSGGKKAASAVAAPRPVTVPSASPVDLIDGVLALAGQCGGFEHLKRLVDRLAELGR